MRQRVLIDTKLLEIPQLEVEIYLSFLIVSNLSVLIALIRWSKHQKVDYSFILKKIKWKSLKINLKLKII